MVPNGRPTLKITFLIKHRGTYKCLCPWYVPATWCVHVLKYDGHTIVMLPWSYHELSVRLLTRDRN